LDIIERKKAALSIPDTWPPDHEMASTATSDDGSVDKAENTAPTIYYGKNPLYNFQKQGHENREVSLQALTSDFEFKQWQESRQLWACIHAKFYVSIPQTRQRRARLRQKDTAETKEHRIVVPEMTPIVEIRATANASVATKFAPLVSTTGTQPKFMSKVRMQRINGLSDDPNWVSGAILERNLFYRVSRSVPAENLDEYLMDSSEFDDTSIPLADNLMLSHWGPTRLRRLTKYGNGTTNVRPLIKMMQRRCMMNLKNAWIKQQT
jgi:hypothetical protein